MSGLMAAVLSGSERPPALPVFLINPFRGVTGQNKNDATGDRPLNRSRYVPHQGAAECARRLRQRERGLIR